MDSAYLPAMARYFASHRELTVTVTTAVVVAIVIIVVLVLRQLARASGPSPAASALARRWDVAVWPLLVVLAVVVVERFRLLG